MCVCVCERERARVRVRMCVHVRVRVRVVAQGYMMHGRLIDAEIEMIPDLINLRILSNVSHQPQDPKPQAAKPEPRTPKPRNPNLETRTPNRTPYTLTPKP